MEVWECGIACQEDPELPHRSKQQTRTYPCTFWYNFKQSVTRISVSGVGDNCERDPAELIRNVAEELWGDQLWTMSQAAYIAGDEELLPKGQWSKIEEWWHYVLVLGFNSGYFDLNVIKEHFSECLADMTTKVKGVKNTAMFIITPGFCFLDIINYLPVRKFRVRHERDSSH